MSQRNPALGGKHANPGQPNRKAMKKLNRRIADWAATCMSLKNSSEGYHRPGSMQLR